MNVNLSSTLPSTPIHFWPLTEYDLGEPVIHDCWHPKFTGDPTPLFSQPSCQGFNIWAFSLLLHYKCFIRQFEDTWGLESQRLRSTQTEVQQCIRRAKTYDNSVQNCSVASQLLDMLPMARFQETHPVPTEKLTVGLSKTIDYFLYLFLEKKIQVLKSSNKKSTFPVSVNGGGQCGTRSFFVVKLFNLLE